MIISGQVVKFALRLLTLTIERACISKFRPPLLSWESTQSHRKTALESSRKNHRQNPPQFGTHSHTAELREADHRLPDYKFKTPFPTEMFVLPFKKSLKCLLLLLILNVLTARVLTLTENINWQIQQRILKITLLTAVSGWHSKFLNFGFKSSVFLLVFF